MRVSNPFYFRHGEQHPHPPVRRISNAHERALISVTRDKSPRAPQEVFSTGLPILDLLRPADHGPAARRRVESGHAAEFGRADVEIVTPSALFEGVWEEGGATRSG